MQKRPWEISDLLALRDGELVDASADVEDPSAQAQLRSIEQLQAQLRALPDVSVDEAIWNKPKVAAAPAKHWMRYQLATAASVFFASVIGIYMLFGDSNSELGRDVAQPDFAGATQIDQSGQQLAQLMNQSRDIERRLQGVDPWTLSDAGSEVTTGVPATHIPSAVEQRLLYRLVDVDAQIARLYDAEVVDSAHRQALWVQRVNLLESLMALRGGSDPRFFEDSRSM